MRKININNPDKLKKFKLETTGFVSSYGFPYRLDDLTEKGANYTIFCPLRWKSAFSPAKLNKLLREDVDADRITVEYIDFVKNKTMHTMKFLMFPCSLHKVNYDMSENAEWIITNDQNGAHSDLGNCIIGTRPPYFVAKIHAYKTQEKRDHVRERDENDRVAWLESMERRELLARSAQKAGVSVRDYVERMGGTYDEEEDELRIIAKVPGLNVYLELFGCMDSEDTGMERWWMERLQADSRIQQPTDRAIYAAALQQLNRAAYFYRATTPKGVQRDMATQADDWQPRDDWREQYDPDEFFPRPERRGIGFDHVDQSRRPTPYLKHQMDAEELAEYNRLKEDAMIEADGQGRMLSAEDLRQLKLTAAANVAARRMMEG